MIAKFKITKLLQAGNVLITRSNEHYLLVDSGLALMLVDIDTYEIKATDYKNIYDDDLKDIFNEEHDIMKICKNLDYFLLPEYCAIRGNIGWDLSLGGDIEDDE